MNYAEWELERQKRALAALLGGGTAEDEDVLRKEDRRGLEAGSPRAGGTWERIVDGERYFYGNAPEDGEPGAWEIIRMAGQDRMRRAWTPEVPVSAWEEILGEAGFSRRDGGGLETNGSDGIRSGFRGGEDGFLPVPAGSQTENRLGTVHGSVPEVGRQRTFAAGAIPGFFPGGDGGETAFRAVSGADEAGGGWPKRVETFRRSQSGGSGQNERTVVQVLEEASGTGTRRGSLGDTALQAEDGAKALSLAVQRDARRYDGGFMIY